MPLISNEMGELYRTDDLEPPKRLKLRESNAGQVSEARKAHEEEQDGDATCRWCGKPYVKRTPNHAFCSDECRKKASELRRKLRRLR